MKNANYVIGFYESSNNEMLESTKHVLDALFSYYKPNSVIDFVCGVGTWVKVFKELSFEKIIVNRMYDVVHPQMFLKQVGLRHPLHVAYKDVLKYSLK